jgi:hypothetical protein
MGTNVIPNEPAITGLTNDVLFNVPKDLGAVSKRVQALVARDRALKGVDKAEAAFTGSADLVQGCAGAEGCGHQGPVPRCARRGRTPAPQDSRTPRNIRSRWTRPSRW